MRKRFDTSKHIFRYMSSSTPFKVMLSVILVSASAATTLFYFQYTELQAKESTNIAKLKKLDSDLATLKKRLAAEKAVRDKAAKDAKIASDEALKTNVSPKPSFVASNAGGPHTDPSKTDVVVNKKRPINPLAYEPPLQTASCAGGDNATINSLVVPDFLAMCQAAATASVPLGISSSYRSYNTQISTYSYWVGVSGVSGADTYSARPGYSEHQTGFAIDFRVPGGAVLNQFTGSAQQLWLAANASSFGFIQRYTNENATITGYNAETWHYRYVGRADATSYATSGAGSLEKFWNIPGGLY